MRNSTLLPSRFFTVAFGALLLAAAARAEDFVHYKSLPVGSHVRIDGKANVHNWAMEGTLISGSMDVPAGVTLDSSQAAVAGLAADGKLKANVEVYIRVTSMNNIHNYEGMDRVMQEAMHASDHPKIQFHLTELAFKQPHAAGAPLAFDAKGELSLNGVTNKIALLVAIESLDKGKLKVVGAGIPVKMTDFKVVPPVTAHVFTTDPDVAISFEWMIGPPKPAAAK